MKTANYNIRIDPVIKSKAEKTFAELGLNLSEAINVFLHASIKWHGFPFDVRIPNSGLIQAIQETEQIINEYADGTRVSQPYTNVHDILQEILNEENDDDV